MTDDDAKIRPESMLSIGAISRATGIPSPTLRTWERRYGFPDPERNPAGHRLYHPDVIERLRLTSRAIDAGYRPSNVVGMSAGDLRELLETSRIDADGYRGTRPDTATGQEAADGLDGGDTNWLETWLQASRDLDGAALSRQFRNTWNRLGGLDFLRQRAAPFIHRIGDAWARGEIKVVHEHYTSENLRDFLSSQWRPMSDRSHGPTAICATPEGELHNLGLHIAALILAMAGWQVIFLGANTPIDDVFAAVDAESPRAVAISISDAYDNALAERYVRALAVRFDGAPDLLTGGAGSPEVAGSKQFDGLETFYRWAFQRAEAE